VLRCNFTLSAAHISKHAERAAQFERVMEEFAEIGVSFVCALKRLHVTQPLVEQPLKGGMKYRDFLRTHGRPSQVMEASKKTGGAC
jgi:hypothetical protein